MSSGPVGAAEHRRDFESKRASLSSWICLPQARHILRVWRALKIPRSTGHPRSGQAFGFAFLLGTFLWRSKEKYLACDRRNTRNKKKNTPRPKWAKQNQQISTAASRACCSWQDSQEKCHWRLKPVVVARFRESPPRCGRHPPATAVHPEWCTAAACCAVPARRAPRLPGVAG
mgnify:CR=1 FL=1